METFIKVFLVLSLSYELLRIYENCFQVHCLSLNNCLILKKNEDFESSQQRKKYLKYLILTHQGNQALRFFHFS